MVLIHPNFFAFTFWVKMFSIDFRREILKISNFFFIKVMFYIQSISIAFVRGTDIGQTNLRVPYIRSILIYFILK